ncbi:UNVERIFIED_CONTAM: hypothetical protein K2H54_061738 [Gekko kuhli]
MAAGGPVKDLCDEATCSICLDFFRDPVAIAECGHSFCRACLTRSWGEPGAARPACPQCRGRAREGSLRPNLQLANIVEIAKRFNPVEEEAEAKGGGGEGGVCEKHGEPLKFLCQVDEAPLCLVCSRTREHRGHPLTPLEEEVEAAGQKKTFAATKRESVCQKHQEPLKLFCEDHEAPICVVCEQSQEHQYHYVIPVEEASQVYKDQFCTNVGILQKERNRILAYKASIVKESQDLLKQTRGEQQKTLIKFRQLQKFLEEQEKLLLAQMEDVEKEVIRNRDRHLARLSEELSCLESLIQVMEEKSQQPASDLLQDARRTLQRYEEKAVFENTAAFPLAPKWHIWDSLDLNPLLEGIKKQFKDAVDSLLHLQNANVTLDPNTAHPRLVQSEGQKSVREGEKGEQSMNKDKGIYTELKDKSIVPGYVTLMLEIELAQGKQELKIPFISVRKELTLPKKLSTYLTIDIEPVGHSLAAIFLFFTESLTMMLNTISVSQSPVTQRIFIPLSEQQSKHAIDAYFDVDSFRFRHTRFGPLGLDLQTHSICL